MIVTSKSELFQVHTKKEKLWITLQNVRHDHHRLILEVIVTIKSQLSHKVFSIKAYGFSYENDRHDCHYHHLSWQPITLLNPYHRPLVCPYHEW